MQEAVSIDSYTVMVLMGSVDLREPSVCFIAAGMDKIEVKNQQIQTKTVEQHVQVGSTAKQQGVYTTHFIPLCHIPI